ncbi:MAG: type IIL restriction-modification enzyme MmeI [Methylococcaceae bacterium]
MKEPQAEKWIRPFSMGNEFINSIPRYCLWLVDIAPNELAKLPEVLKRVEAVKKMRLASKAASTRKFAEKPAIFCQLAQPDTDYLAIPKVSSETRRFIPIGYLDKQVISGDKLFTIANATLYHFGILTSTMHNAWMRSVCGRMKSDYSYSNTIVYNNFPFPTPTEKQIKSIEEKAQAVLDARAVHENSTLADLYNPLTMPANLVKAHNELDKAVDSAYNYKGSKDDAARVAFLFEKYQELVAPLVEIEKVKTRKVKK